VARGQAQAADQQRGLSNTAAGVAGGNAAGELGTLGPQAQSLINSKGYDPATLAAITNAGMGGVNAAFGDAAGQVNRNAALTKNPAGVTEGLDTLAMNKGIAGGKEAGDIQIQNADFANQQRMAGLNLLNSLYGTNTQAQTSLLGQGPADLQARAAGGGWSQGFKDVLSSLKPSGGGGGGGTG
jgi:hypothetical protein